MKRDQLPTILYFFKNTLITPGYKLLAIFKSIETLKKIYYYYLLLDSTQFHRLKNSQSSSAGPKNFRIFKQNQKILYGHESNHHI